MEDKSIIDEKDLFQRISLGDEAAFRTLFHHYNSRLRRFLTRLIHTPQEEEEVLQEVFLKIWMYRAKLAEVEYPRAYILRIVSNEATNYLQKLAKQNRLALKVRNLPDTGSWGSDQELAAKETAGLIAQAVQQLTPACRQVYLLSREENLSIPEIADRLKVSESTVKNQLVRALKDLRQHIGRTAFISLLYFL